MEITKKILCGVLNIIQTRKTVRFLERPLDITWQILSESIVFSMNRSAICGQKWLQRTSFLRKYDVFRVEFMYHKKYLCITKNQKSVHFFGRRPVYYFL